eukprot:Plantae.Rhodophyta-Rhodochaete_pulchella.ctg3722.p1 GENE.Plantae.Rhodophyta-Rhodochaete_pulchella.ctg3722~~Plantae.Rhodophyta-Rhodochaete_pulchella.ctg3722.p1  ORF type:complete len:344 (+),score=41.69 Plantae.Rhodophyta-Rhodochaete_pulchella.ctg3722:37-1032(+)
MLGVDFSKSRNTLDVKAESLPVKALSGVNVGTKCQTAAHVQMDFSAQRGKADVQVDKARLGPTRVASISCELRWLGDTVVLHRSVLRQMRSEYHLEGLYQMPEGSSLPKWEFKAVIPRADVRDLTSIFTSKKYPTDNGFESEWTVPDLPLGQQLVWFENFMTTQKELELRRESSEPSPRKPDHLPEMKDVHGSLFGTLSVKHNGDSDPIKALSVEADIGADNLQVGRHILGLVTAKAVYREGSLVVEPIHARRPNGFEFVAFGTISRDQHVDGLITFRKASAETLSRYSIIPLKVSGGLSADIEISGTLDRPTVNGKAVWTRAMLNKRKVP